MLNTEKFVSTHKANLDALRGMAAKAFAGVEQLTALNLQVAKASFDDVAEASLAVLSARDPQSLMAIQSGLIQPTTDKVNAYGRQVYDILVASKADFEALATEQASAAQKSMVGAMEAAAKNAPEGAGSGVALFKSAMATANNAFDGMQKASRQVTEATQANLTAVTGTVTKAVAKAKRA